MAKTASAKAVQHEEGPDLSKLDADIQRVHKSAKPIQERTGEHRERIKQILDQRGYHKGAFGDLVKIDRMSETKRADFLRTFVPAFNIMAEKWGADVIDLLPADEEPESNVTPITKGQDLSPEAQAYVEEKRAKAEKKEDETEPA